jgi:hypothetical protein
MIRYLRLDIFSEILSWKYDNIKTMHLISDDYIDHTKT